MSDPTPSTEPAARPMASPLNDLRKIRNNSGAAAKELREFLSQLQGRNPREVLSAVSTSGLFRGVAVAFVWTLVITAVFTAGPYVLGEIKGGKKEQAAEKTGEGQEGGDPVKTAAAGPGQAAAPADPAAAPAKAGDLTPAPAAAAGTPAAPGAAPTGAEATKAVDSLGIGEAKSAPANVNPLEKAADDLLKGLD